MSETHEANKMAEARTYAGGCHCKRVRYEVTTAIDRVMECNCSICSKKAAKMIFVPESAFHLLSGEDALTDYRFKTHNIAHVFCETCGIGSFAKGTAPDGSKMVCINARCLDGVDLTDVPVNHNDGKSR